VFIKAQRKVLITLNSHCLTIFICSTRKFLVFYSSFKYFHGVLDLSKWFWGPKKTQKWPMFGVVFSNIREEKDIDNFFFESFAPLYCQKKNLRHIFYLEKKIVLIRNLKVTYRFKYQLCFDLGFFLFIKKQNYWG